MNKIHDQLLQNGYCIIPNVLNPDEIDACKESFLSWHRSIPDDDISTISEQKHGIYKYHHAGHTWHSWFIRTHPKVQAIFKSIYQCEDLIVSFDGCNYLSKDTKTKDTCWTHTDQAPSTKGFQCYQGLVSLTDNQERTLVVYEGTHHLHHSYFKEKGIQHTKNWQLIDPVDVAAMEDRKRVLHIPSGALVLWDSRVFHQNQYGKPDSEERMVQYVCFLPKSHPHNTKDTTIERLKYFRERRTTTHWPAPIYVNKIDYSILPIPSLDGIPEEDILKLIL